MTVSAPLFFHWGPNSVQSSYTYDTTGRAGKTRHRVLKGYDGRRAAKDSWYPAFIREPLHHSSKQRANRLAPRQAFLARIRVLAPHALFR
eukprot:6515232-Pyramimonas_sp.AAC.1